VEGKVDLIVGLDARGFLFGPIMAAELEVPFVPVTDIIKALNLFE
jgi:adenine phosphoribosyltransferase